MSRVNVPHFYVFKVCQYETLNKDMTFEIGQFGNATFGQYNNETKSISLKYYGVPQSGSTRLMQL